MRETGRSANTAAESIAALYAARPDMVDVGGAVKPAHGTADIFTGVTRALDKDLWLPDAHGQP